MNLRDPGRLAAVILSLSFTPLLASAQVNPQALMRDLAQCTGHSQRTEIQSAIASLSGRAVIQPIEGKFDGEIPISDEPLPGYVQASLDRVSIALFGHAGIFKAFTAARPRDNIRWDYARMAVIVNPKDLDYFAGKFSGADFEAAVTYAMAHELSHYLQDLFYQEGRLARVTSSEISGALWHAQTDAIALEVLRKMGEPLPVSLAVLSNFVAEAWAHAKDCGLKATDKIVQATKSKDCSARAFSIADAEIRKETVSQIIAGSSPANASSCYVSGTRP